MINFEIFLIGLMVVSTLTGLVTEAIKKLMNEHKKTYHANTLAGIVATILSAAIGVGYVIVTGTSFTAQIIVCIIALIFMGWLCAMVGYDKVVGQFKKINNEEE
jgi:putative Mn2+ efflux pump MntP